jgi:hypothetical protein
MSVYDLHFNKDDVAIRNILIGFLATLHDSIHWYNQVGSDITNRRLVKVPFYFSTTGTERYLQDNFLNNIDFDPESTKAEAFYNQIPRGISDLQGITIDGSSIVNKYVRMQHQRQEQDGTLRTYSSEAFMVPITFSMECIIYTDSIVDQLKCTESIIKTFFKNKVFEVDIAYTRIPCLAVFSDNYTNERTVEFSFTDKREFKTTFSIEIKSHIPVYKEGTEIFAGTTMESFGGGQYLPPIVMAPGSNILNTNTGAPPPSGFPGGEFPFTGDDGTQIDGSGGADSGGTGSTGLYGTGLIHSYQGGVPNEPAWPITRPSLLPPDGGATSYIP